MRMINNLKADPPKIINDLRHLVKTSMEAFGDKDFYTYKEHNEIKHYTYTDIWENMNRLGTAFAVKGLMGKRIAVIGELHPGWITTYLATVNGGGVIVPLDKEIDEEHLIGFIELAEISAIFYTESLNNRIAKLEPKIPNVEMFCPIVSSTEEIKSDKIIPYDELIALGQAELEKGNTTYLDHEIDMGEMCALLFTSGTTGTSKGVMLSQKNLTAAVNASCLSMSYDHKNTFVSVLPPHHTYELTCGNLAMINIGGSVFINDSIKYVMRNFASFKPNTLVLVPLFLETMHKKIWDEINKKGMTKKVKLGMKASAAMLAVGIDKRQQIFSQILGAFGGNLQSIVCGGAPLSPQIIKDFYAFGITVLEGYGITECAPLVAVNSPGKVKFHSVGQPVYGCEVKIDKTPDEETGEILVKGDNVMMGYYKNPEATAEVFTEDGFFRTGDIGYMDKDNYIFITGRKKNVIILSNGKNVFPEEIEERLSAVEIISESVVIGRQNDNGEIVITAIVVPNMECLENKNADEVYTAVKDAVNEINRHLPSFKQVHDIEIRYEEFEKTTSRKIKRYIIK